MKNPWELDSQTGKDRGDYGSMASFFGGFTVPAYAAAKAALRE